MAVYSPALMLQDGGAFAMAYGYWTAVAYIVMKTTLAIGLWGAAVIGFMVIRLSIVHRLIATSAAFTLFAALPLTDEIGFALTVVFGIMVWRASRVTPARPVPVDESAVSSA
jgi:TRAP-type uncharacterized transport system fused permease subunit